jgi:hypothetical protein
MADNSDDPVMQNAHVVQGARAIRTNPALLAALMSPPAATPSSDDPNVAGLATHNSPPTLRRNIYCTYRSGDFSTSLRRSSASSSSSFKSAM